FCDENPEDELVPELRAELETAPVQYARYQRRYLGWGVLALMRRRPGDADVRSQDADPHRCRP
ncbi:MAG: hypothetical protein ACTH9F_11050, partial [Brachybacterium tyrofermentans]